MLTRGSLESPYVYLTFDDGPDTEWTPRMLDVLAKAGARATFFVIGQAARRAPELVRRAASEGHMVGNHSWSHRHPWLLSESTARQEVRDGAAAIADIIGRETSFFRPPHGRLRRCMIDEAENHGETVVLWSRSAIDWGPLGHPAGIRRRLLAIRPGEIVLMHDGRRRHNRPQQTSQVLPEVLDRIRELDLNPAPLDRMARH
jgi:peptidoglycan/xylan/chitin deacetylase (PgdA/CDA1 family)